MVTPSISHTDSPPQEQSPVTLKEVLVHLGLQALRTGDQRRVDLITLLIRAGGLVHE